MTSDGALTIRKFYGDKLMPVDQVVSLLKQETDASCVSEFTKAVEAARMIDANNQERSNYWGELGIWSTKRLGQLISEGQEAGSIATGKSGRPKKAGHDGPLPLQGVLGTKTAAEARHISKRAQKVAALSQETINGYFTRQREQDEEISKAGLLRAAGSDGTICTKHGNDVIEWYTPEKYIEAARAVMGSIDVDPASSKRAQKIVKATTYYTAQDDGLAHQWSGNVFLNPPYKMPLIRQFCFRLCESVASSDVKQAVLLVNDNTDTKWWHRAAGAASAICFHVGRISFYNAAGEWSSPTNGQTIFYCGRRHTSFCNAFGEFGLCLKR